MVNKDWLESVLPLDCEHFYVGREGGRRARAKGDGGSRQHIISMSLQADLYDIGMICSLLCG